MTHNKKHTALKQWTIGSRAFSLYTTKLVVIETNWFGQATSQTPLNQFEGIVIKSNANHQLELYLMGKPCVAPVSFEAIDEDEIIAEWRSLGAKTQLPLLIEHEDGTILPAQKRLGALVITHKQRRRRGFATLNSRRPNAPMRRKSIMKALAKSA